MKHLIISVAICALAVAAQAQEFERTAHGLRTTVPDKGIDIEVEWYTPRTVRVLKSPHGMQVTKTSLSVIAKPETVEFRTRYDGDGVAEMSSDALTVRIDGRSGVVSFADAGGEGLLSETENDRAFTPFNDAGRDTYAVYQGFDTDDDEGLYGLGQLQNGELMQRGMTKYLVQGNVEDVTPLFQSTKGYGIFWDNYSGTLYIDNDEETSFRSDVGDCMDYYFMYGGSADGVIGQIRALTGDVPMMPLWGYGFMQSKERYKSQDETVGVVRRYRELGVPLDCIIQDWQYWGHNYLWNAMDFKNPAFSRPQQMVDEVHAMNARMMISIWSSFGPATKPYRELNSKGLLFDIETWPQSGVDGWPPDLSYPSGVRVYDAYSPEARDIYWKYLKSGLYDIGIDGWWMDSTEPDHFNPKDSDFDRQTGMGSYRSVRNAYPLVTVGGVSDHQRAVTSDRRVLILTRSGFVGQQRYGSVVWSGDVQSSWDMLRRQVTAGLNFSLTGMPHWNSDLGGFFAGSYNTKGPDSAPENPMYRELYVRWMQFGVFCPMMRSHGADASREVFRYGKAGEPVYDALVDAIKLRYRLLPYIYSTSWEVTHDRGTFMRALFMDFVDDRNTWNTGDEYMFGRAFLVAPVLEAQYTPEQEQRQLAENEGWGRGVNTGGGESAGGVDFTQSHTMDVYLPAGTSWYDFWSGERHDGGGNVTVTTTIDRIPLFVRAGSIVPLGPDVQYSGEKAWNELTLCLYPGADGEFTLYEDSGDGYDYESGAYTEIEMRWNDSRRTLTINPRRGSYDGMSDRYTFTLRMPDGRERTVTYTGKRLTVKM